MTIYGYQETVDDRPATLVVAADTVDEFSNFCDTLRQMDIDDEAKFVELYSSNFLDAMRDERYKGYKHSVICAYHASEEQRTEFVAKYGILEVMSAVGRDRQLDMLHAKQLQIEEETLTDEQKDMTIEERFGLDKNDPWDRRSEEEKAADEQMKKKIAEMRAKGELSGDSFGGADDLRASRERFSGQPLSRTDAIQKLTEVYSEDVDCGEDVPDFEAMSNEELSRAYNGIDELDAQLRPVFKDDEMPVEKVDNGEIFLTKVETDGDIFNEDGSINVSAISNVQAHKEGGQIDEALKQQREEAHQTQVDTAKAGRKSFSPDDFAAVLRGDGSADAVTNVAGDDRQKRVASTPRPSLSDAAEAARKEYQAEQEAAAERAQKLASQEAEIRGKKEREAGIFRGAALDPEGETLPWESLSEELRKEMEEHGLKQDAFPVKNYPYNSEVGGRVLLPYDLAKSGKGYRVLGGDNIEIEGAMQLGDSAVAVIKKKDPEQEAVVLCGRPRVAGDADKPDISIVRIR